MSDTDALTPYQRAAHIFLSKNGYSLYPAAVTELGAMLAITFQRGYACGRQSPRTVAFGILSGISILLGTVSFALWLMDAHLQVRSNHVVLRDPCAMYAGLVENCLLRRRE